MREDRRFVVGQGRYVADVALEGMLHVAVLPSQHPAARIVSIDTLEAMKMPGVHYVLTGEELAKATEPLMNGLETPNVRRFPLAVGQVRYAGEWVVAVVAESRAQAEDAAEKVRVEYEPLPYVIDSEEAYDPSSTPVHAAHGSNVLLDKTFVWGDVDKHFAESPRHLSFRVVWGRSSTVPIETFGVAAKWDPWREILDVWASIQMPKYSDQIARSLRIPAQQRPRPSGRRCRRQLWRQARHQADRHCLASGAPPGPSGPLIEDRLDNMRAGDAHGPDRIFDVEVAFNDEGIVKSMKMRALDNVGAYAGRSPFQLGKPIGAIVGPYKIQSVKYRARLGDLEQGGAGSRARLRPGADQLCDRDRDRQGRGGRRPRPHRDPPAQFHPQATSFPISFRAARITTAATITPSSPRCWRTPTTKA